MGLRLRDINNALSRDSTEDLEDLGDLVNGGLLYPKDYNSLLGIPREYPVYLLLGKPAA
jgi:hypothetical protein